MKAQVTITFTADSEQLNWQEHGKPFHVSRKAYLETYIQATKDGSKALPDKANFKVVFK